MPKYIKTCPVCSETQKLKYERTLNHHDLVECENCSFVFADISQETALGVNSAISEEVDSVYVENQTGIDRMWFRFFARKVSRHSPQKGEILDIGCGNGMLLSILKQFGWSLHGNDLSPWAEKYAERLGYKLHNQLIENLNFKNEFDCIVSTSTFEHVVNPAEHLSKIIDALKSGGYCWITIPNYNSLSIRLNISRFDYNQPPFHVNYFTPHSLKQLFKILQRKHDFTYGIRVYGIPELFSFYVFLNRFFNKIFKKKNISKPEHSEIEKIETSKQSPEFLKSSFYKSIVLFNYYVGGIFRIGDRIEFYIHKK
jgi:SAM-dependent methyltransferase